MTVTIGGFDGMHVGHQALICKAQKLIVIEKGSNLTPGDDRCEYTDLPCHFFNLNEIKNLEAEKFINILKNLNTTKVVIGEDFKFGKERKGDASLLKKHFAVEVIKEVKIDGIGVHSQIIREFLKKGLIKKATKFLGHLYKIKGRQIKGQGLGGKELVPTINITPVKNYLIPKEGVYITLTGSKPSLTFIGIRSTDNKFSIETHILNQNYSIVNEPVKIEFLEFLRENKKFESIEALKNQIKKDLSEAENYAFPITALN
ncbi:bifunctional riboflavin kinase/FAD synthetase [Nautilia sp. PV-1]|uniref:bifunctional riboflavin kinase/FAD synthetase n=1 Tax=Nautilia sp. PV-1 TaxID=2579250 RepID=UPI000FDA1F5A|nr:bifunctional riboflavin kinase/FAD synthetase [Nautilia sp. PV-1]AZV46686.1 bifunctional riboflavin kinase/FAD synthetase [Nautilia sp. PV-1]